MAPITNTLATALADATMTDAIALVMVVWWSCLGYRVRQEVRVPESQRDRENLGFAWRGGAQGM